MKILFFDLETTGIDPKTANPIELACSVYNVSGKREAGFETKIWSPEWTDIPDEVVELTGITTDECKRWGVTPEDAFHVFRQFTNSCDVLCAHNGTRYDYKILDRLGLVETPKVRVDTRVDIRFTKGISKSRKLIHLCAEHRIPLLAAHTASADVEAMAALFFKYNPLEIIERAKSPLIYIKAGVTRELKDRAKERGYYWDPRKNFMIWYKQIRECDGTYEKDLAAEHFPIFRLPSEYAPPEE
jgi:DNA polymerase III alpha subunit (gram-positive type)